MAVAQSQEPLRRAEATFRDLLDTTTDAIAVHRERKIVYANRAALELFGYASLDEVLGRSPFDFVSPAFRALVSERVLQTYVKHSATKEVEERLLHRRGYEVPVEVFSLPVLFEGQPATLVHIRDLTVRKELEMRLDAADRLAGLGLAAAGIAHEINTPLAYALLNLELLEKLMSRPAEERGVDLAALAAAARQGVEQAAQAAKGVRGFIQSEPRRGLVDVRAVLDSCARFAQPEIATRARLVKEYGEVPVVVADPARLGQVFLNLLMNAAEAIAPGNVEHNAVTLRAYVRTGSVVVEIEDTGCGIREDLRKRIFDPLFTSKSRGTGLGLSISRKLLEDEGGRLEVESEMGRGSRFRVVFPPPG